ncbi:hypothetical protein [Peribacillus sp. SCS-155]|uniref:hypothetical protein n=1 Tax=Peribacillus sedimenti TaxID=3115297 RepID=UPI003905B584
MKLVSMIPKRWIVQNVQDAFTNITQNNQSVSSHIERVEVMITEIKGKIQGINGNVEYIHQ